MGGHTLSRYRSNAEVDVIGIDLDAKDLDLLERILGYCSEVGIVTMARESGRGFHVRVSLDRPLPYLDSFILRHRLGDDAHRILYDLRRYQQANYMAIDVLFDSKVILRGSLHKGDVGQDS